MRYAKLIDGELILAPNKLVGETTTVYNPTPEMLMAEGYKPVRFTDPPVVPEGFYSAPDWEEHEDEIVQTWTVLPAPVSEEDALIRYSNEITGAEDETLPEAAETLIKSVMEVQ